MGLPNILGRPGPARLLSALAAAAFGSISLLLLVHVGGEADRVAELLVAVGGFGLMLAIATSYGWLIDRVWRQTNKAVDIEITAFKDEFIARLSHQLRTHLTGIVGYAQLIETRSADDVEAVSTVVAQSIELTSVVDDLVVTARVDADLLTVHPRTVSVWDEATAVMELLDLLGANVQLDCRDGEILVDSVLFRHVLRNLLVNAHRHGRPPVALRGRASGEHYILQVVDRGPGVDHEMAEQLFGRFVHRAHDERAPGALGLGLAVVKELSDRLGWAVTYRRLNEETHFILTLPLARSRIGRLAQLPMTAGLSFSDPRFVTDSLATTGR